LPPRCSGSTGSTGASAASMAARSGRIGATYDLFGRPQFGHAAAASENSFPQSGQVMRAMARSGGGGDFQASVDALSRKRTDPRRVARWMKRPEMCSVMTRARLIRPVL
jgi:hypothetical protein